ncbi:MAG: phosphatidate cytidylyltransferase [Candidatus Cloacimonetes bacterium]|nr:phosphatidate cytidylyltransferase [Candidatus Cloacimonadota bacterium]MCB5287526.1 phosphatidate cytidylyltransferase [Candidatus Cloacimonadota bacterium]MCK9183758.1 phosphatidate cytidylyltransferase [Candidatus Cloacimonadota bacterium]MCK9583467.1 phosphatidate cytidylyltransferase [Candidatus Cloacimonadota bacterium]MDY0229847.1 phosphatidate cytidylyltransferase [Candidatus Cloacimonadaceae bacterium]
MVIPFGYHYVLKDNRHLAFVLLFCALAISLVIEFNRFWQKSFRKTFHRIFGSILRRHELKDLTGATYLLFASLLCVAFFDPRIAGASIAFLSIGDTFAALIGMNFGKRKFLRNNKTLEGSLACFISCLIFGLWWLGNPWLALLGALTATAAELGNIALDDNIKIPLASGIVMSLVSVFI